MADIEQGKASLLTTKWGPLPVWAWGGITLALAWAYAKWRDSKKKAAAGTGADSTGTGDAGAETDAVAPQFVIENNLPGGGTATTSGASAPVIAPPPPSVVVTPPATTSKPPVVTGHPIAKKPLPPSAKKPTGPAKKAPISYKVVHGDTLTSIAERHHTTAAKLFTYNTTPGVRPAATIATLKQRGPNTIFAGETILIPQ